MKISGNRFAYLLLLIGTTQSLNAYPWPFKGATSTQQKVRQTVGAYRSTNRFHLGVDIVPNDSSDERIYSVVAGKYEGIGGTGLATFVQVDNLLYIHIYPDASLKALTIDQSVLPVGTLLGTIRPVPNTTHHVHLQEVAGNALLSLSNFVDSTKPLVQSTKIFRQMQPNQNPALEPELIGQTIYGMVDLRVKGYDHMDPVSTVTDYPGVMPYALGFRVFSYVTDSYVVDKSTTDPTIRFASYPTNTNANFIHFSQSNSSPEYWITNTTVDGEDPEDRWWHTRGRIGGNWDEEETNAARGEWEARTHDGKARIEVVFADTKGNVNDLSPGVSEKEVVIDNFIPFRVGVTIGVSTAPAFDDEWDFQSHTGLYEYGSEQPELIAPGESYPVELEFSEPVQNPTMDVNGSIGSVSLYQEDSAGKFWIGTMMVPNGTPQGLYTASIQAQDLATNPANSLLALSSTSDFSQPHRNSNGNFPFYNAGADTVVQFNVGVDTAPQLTVYDDQHNTFQPVTSGIYATAVSSTTGIDWVEVNDNLGTTVIADNANPPGETSFSTPYMGPLGNGNYQVSAYSMSGLRTDQGITICRDPNNCQDPCQGLTADQCKQFCDKDPDACQADCNRDPNSLACQESCKNPINTVSCQKRCLMNPTPPPYCPQCSGPNPPPSCTPPPPIAPHCAHPVNIHPPKGQCHGSVSVTVCQGCPTVPVWVTVGGNTVALNSLNNCANFTSVLGRGQGIDARICVGSQNAAFCTTEDLTGGMCLDDPTFIGGDLPTLPDGPTIAPPAFSPGIPGSPHPVYTYNYQESYSTASVSVMIRDASGALVRTLQENAPVYAGNATFTWNGTNDQGVFLPEGLYTWYLFSSNPYDSTQYNETSGVVAIDNTYPVARLSTTSVSPADNTLLQINGTATDQDFVSYTVDYSSGPSGPWTSLIASIAPQSSGLLTAFSTTGVSPGTYTARLTVADSAGLVSVATEPIVVSSSTGTGIRLMLGTTTQTVENPGAAASPDNPDSFVDESLPASGSGTAPSFNWTFVSNEAYSGATSHTDDLAPTAAGTRVHYFIKANPGYAIASGDSIVQYVYLSPQNTPTELLLGFYTGAGNGEHRVYWGANNIPTGGIDGSPSLLKMGDLPPAGEWVRLKIPASAIGLDGQTLTGVVYGAYSGVAYWDKTTSSHPSQDTQTTTFAPSPPTPNATQTETTLPYIQDRATHLKIDVYSRVNETWIKTLFNAEQSSGAYSVTWDQTDANGNVVPDADYFFRFTSPDGPIDSEAIVLGSTTSFTGTFHTSAPDADENLYTLNATSGTITKKTPSGYLLTAFGQGQLNHPTGLALDTSGYVVVQEPLGLERFEVGRVDFSARTLTAQISVPSEQALIKATVPIFGYAYGRNFSSYEVDIAPTWNPSSFTVLNQSASEASTYTIPPGQETLSGNLATWQTGLVPTQEYPVTDLFHPPVDLGYKGRWTVRLTVKASDGTQQTTQSHVIIGRVVNNGTGGLIVSDDGQADIVVPALSLQNEWDIFGLITATTTLPAQMPPMPKGVVPVSPIYQMIPGGYTFLKPTTFQIALSSGATLGTGGLVDPSRVGLFEYSSATGAWSRLNASLQTITSSGTVVGTLYSDAQYSQVPNGDGYYALFASTAAPAPPMLNPIDSPTSVQQVLLSGTAAPYSRIQFHLTASPTTFALPTLESASDGSFEGNVFLPQSGLYQMTATATDFSGNTSTASAPISISVVLSTPSVISSVRFTDVTFSTVPANGSLLRGGAVYIQMQASDIDPGEVDTVYVVLKSAVTDPIGIVVPLTQIDAVSPVYEGTAHLGNVSDPSSLTLGVQVNGEIVTALAQAKPSVQASMPASYPTPAFAPTVFSRTHPSALQDTFENGPDDWSTYNSQSGATVQLDTTTASTGQTSLRLTQQLANGDFSAYVTQTPFDARKNSLVDFDYKLDPAHVPAFNFYFRYQNMLHEVTFTGGQINLPPGFAHLGSVAAQVQADNRWHTVEFNLGSLFSTLYPSTTAPFIIDEVIIGGWQQEQYFGVAPLNVSTGSYVNLDNVRIWPGGVASRDAALESVPPSLGAQAFRYSLDTSSTTVPTSGTVSQASNAFFSALADGRYYFHVQTEDNGVWGPPNHYLFQVNRTPPVLSMPSPAQTFPLTRSAQTNTSVHVTDASGIDLSTLQFTVNGTSYTAASGGIGYDAPSGLLSITLPALTPVPPVVHDGDVVTVVITGLSDSAGNAMTQPFQWSWQASLSSLSGSQFYPVTFNGGQDPAWSPDATRLAFASNRSGSYNLYYVSANASSALVESTATLTEVTASSANLTQPAWSPDGKRLAFVSDQTGTKQLWIMPYDASSPPVRLTTTGQDDEHPAWSPDGAHLVFSRSSSGYGNLWALDLNATTGTKIDERQLTSADVGFDLEPRYSSDGQSIVYRRSLYVDNVNTVHSDGSAIVPLTQSGKETTPGYSSDDTSVVFASARAGAVPGLWVMDTSGQNAQPLIDNLGLYTENEPLWSSDGGRVAFTSTRSGSPNIWLLYLLKVSSLTATPSDFSPSGTSASAVRSIVFGYQLSASNALVTMDILDDSNHLVKRLLSADLESSGTHSVSWNGVNASSQPISDGTYTMRLTVTGQSATTPLVSQINFQADSTPPAVSLGASSGNLGGAGFYNGSTVFSVQAVDASPLTETDLAIDSTRQFVVAPSTFSLMVGTHSLTMRAVDAAGNVSLPLTVPANIDNVSPVSSATIQGLSFADGSGTLYVSSVTSFQLTAIDPSTGPVVSGIYQTTATLDGGLVSAATGTLVIPALGAQEGPHLLSFSAQDQAGNEEPTHVLNLFLDNTPPIVSYTATPPIEFNRVHYFASTGTVFGFVAQDPLSSGGASGAGPAVVSVDGGPYLVMTSTLTFPTPGVHQLSYDAVDQVGNTSAVQTLNVTVGSHPPTAILNVSTPSYTLQGIHYASALTRFTLSVASGTAAPDNFQLSLDSAAYQVYTTTSVLTISSQGPHSVTFRAVRQGVAESSDTYVVMVDTTPPVESATLVPPAVGGLARPDSVITLSSTDTLSGVSLQGFSVDGSTFVYTSPFTIEDQLGLTSGHHTLATWAVDNVGNISPPHVSSFTFDNIGPTVSIAMVGGHQYPGGSLTYASGDTGYGLSASDPLGAGIVAIDVDSGTGAGYQTYTGTITYVTQGLHTINAYATNTLQQVSVVDSFQVDVDTQGPPVTVTPQGPVFVSTNSLYATSQTKFAVAGGDDNLSGLAHVEAFVDSVTVPVPVQIVTEGIHHLVADAVDNVGNKTAVPYAATVIIDNTPPVSSISQGARVLTPGTTAFIQPGARLSLSATDYFAGHETPGAGVQKSFLSIDGGPNVVNVGTFTVTLGSHRVSFYSTDELGNTETPKTIWLTADNQPPSTQVVFSTAAFAGPSGVPYISSNTTIGFVAVDSGTPASGVAITQYEVDASTTFLRYSAPFKLVEGLHTVKFQSEDNAGNLETLHLSTVAVDATPPVISLNYSSGTLITTSTVFGLTAGDPLSNGVSSGLRLLFIAQDSGAFSTYSSSFVITSSGTHTLAWYGVDHVGNASVPGRFTFQMAVDTVAPTTELTVSTTAFVNSGLTFISSSTSVGFSAQDAGTPTSGVSFTQFELDSATSFTHYSVPFKLVEGFHTIRFQSQDRTGNLETLHVSSVAVDATPPLTSLVYPAGTIISTSTVLSLIANDPVSKGIASGIHQIFLAKEGGAFTTYSGSFVLASTGTHTIAWYAVDRVGNTEVVKSTSVVLSSHQSSGSHERPVAELLSPSPLAGGLDEVFSAGQLPLIGTVQSDHLESYQLQWAAGLSGGTSFQTIATGTSPVTSDLLAVFDTRALQGFYTVRLLAQDHFGQTSESRATIYVGSPAMMWCAKNESEDVDDQVLIQPQAIQADELGNVFVASAGLPRVVKLDSNGRLLDLYDRSAVFTPEAIKRAGIGQSSAGYRYVIDPASLTIVKIDGRRNVVERFGPEFSLKQPSGLALDGQGNLYLSDGARNRVCKFGVPSDGLQTQLLVLSPLSGNNTSPLPASSFSGSSPNPAFEWGSVFVFPNPARGGAEPTLHAEIGIVDRVTFKIYNVAGQELEQAEIDQPPTIIDSGQGPRYAYEYTWTGHIASDVYFFVIDAEKSGSHKTKAGKFSVVR